MSVTIDTLRDDAASYESATPSHREDARAALLATAGRLARVDHMSASMLVAELVRRARSSESLAAVLASAIVEVADIEIERCEHCDGAGETPTTPATFCDPGETGGACLPCGGTGVVDRKLRRAS